MIIWRKNSWQPGIYMHAQYYAEYTTQSTKGYRAEYSVRVCGDPLITMITAFVLWNIYPLVDFASVWWVSYWPPVPSHKFFISRVPFSQCSVYMCICMMRKMCSGVGCLNCYPEIGTFKRIIYERRIDARQMFSWGRHREFVYMLEISGVSPLNWKL